MAAPFRIFSPSALSEADIMQIQNSIMSRSRELTTDDAHCRFELLLAALGIEAQLARLCRIVAEPDGE